jgi:N-acetylneuraminate synthase
MAFIIAEAGVNHNGSIKNAKKLVDIAKNTGCDAVKFQSFQADKLVTQSAKKADYQTTNSGSGNQYQMLQRLELNFKVQRELKEYCNHQEIIFMSSPFDCESANFLNSISMDIFKIPSGEIINYELLSLVASFQKRVILSTGMANMSDIDRALRVLLDGGLAREKITVLQCNTEYPTPFEDVNLNAMTNIGRAFGVDIGYSDHTKGIEVAIAAVALGAKVIEKHITISKDMEGPDHKASIEEDELKLMVSSIRNIEKAMGNGIKDVSNSEAKNIKIARKKIVASKTISIGEIFTHNNLTLKRANDGITGDYINLFFGRVSNKRYNIDDVVEL